ncbi:unnamed protein product, partial [Didymodactylos carnosus]
MALLPTEKYMNIRNLLTNFIIDTIINDGFMEYILSCRKQCRDINRRYRPISLRESENYLRNHQLPLLLTGSFAEGLNIPSLFSDKCTMDISDCDIIYTIPLLTCNMSATNRKTAVFLINTQHTHSGYLNLILDTNSRNIKSIPYEYVSDLNLIAYKCADEIVENQTTERHGPAQQIDSEYRASGLNVIYSKDFVVALQCLSWPAPEWIERQRSDLWPKSSTIKIIVQQGCHVVPVFHAKSNQPDIEWRYSFSYAELILAEEIPYYTRKTYLIFKLLCKKYLNPYFPLKTYYLKTILFWCCEEYPAIFLENNNDLLVVKIQFIATKLDKLMERLSKSIEKQELPNYFIRTNNMFDCCIDSHTASIIEKIQYLRQN